MAWRRGGRPGWATTGIVALVAVALIGLAIIGTLIAIALPSFRGYVMRVRASEAPTFLGEIRLREEVYRAAFSEYCPTEWSPSAVPADGALTDFDPTLAGWRTLVALPDGPVRFRDRVLTGTPGHAAVPGIPGVDDTDFTFVMQAEADLDGDGDVMAIEGYSESHRLYFSRGIDGPPLESGWE